MELFITHESALEYWRDNDITPDNLAYRQRKRMAPAKPASHSVLKQTHSLGLSLPINITISLKESRHKTSLARIHVFSLPFPEGCFIRVSEGVYVASPELCFFQMANKLPFIKLIELGFELCGFYPIPRNGYVKEKGANKKAFDVRRLRTSTKKLAAFLERMKGIAGQRQALRALNYILDRSASPMETKLTLLLTLPYRLGGFGLPKPKLNDGVNPSKKVLRNASQSVFVCDLCWPEADLIVEYDSEKFHEGARRITKDSKRRNALISTGKQVISITKDEIKIINQFEDLVELIAINLGARLRHSECQGFLQKHMKLHHLLFHTE